MTDPPLSQQISVSSMASEDPMSNLETSTSTNSIITTDDEESDFDAYAYRIKISWVMLYLFAIILILGLIFNTLALVCFLTSRTLRRNTTGFYLIALTCADMIFLVGDFLRWLNSLIADEPAMGIDFYDRYNFWCKIIYFLRYFGKLVSAWITVAITLERFISIAYPLKAGQLSTKTNTRVVIVSTYLCCFALTSFPFWTLGIVHYPAFSFCTYYSQAEYNIWNWVINRVGSLFLPSAIIFIVTGMILVKLRILSKQRKALISQNMKSSLERQLTMMLIAVAVSFLLLRLPYTISYYLFDFREDIWQDVSDKFEAQLWAVSKFADALATSNYAINFFLYCLAGSAFRSQFLALICCRRRELRRGKTVSTPNTLSTAASVRSTLKLSPMMSRSSAPNTVKSTKNGVSTLPS